jgi:hypothetical protein
MRICGPGSRQLRFKRFLIGGNSVKKSLVVAYFCFVMACISAAQIVDTTVCDVLANPQSFDGKTIRVKGTVVAGFDEFIVKGSGCNYPVSAIWLAYPEGTKAKAGPAVFLQLQLGSKNPSPTTSSKRSSVKLDKSKDFKQFDSLLSAPYKSGGMCLGCVRYTVAATLVGRLDGAKSTGVVRDKSGKVVGVDGSGNLNRYNARLVLQGMSDVSSQEIDYMKSASAGKGDSQRETAGGDPVAAAHQAARAFSPGSASAEQVERAAAAFGKEGEDNGVEVGFGSANEVPKSDGPKGDHDSPDGLLFNCTFDMDRLKGDALARAIVHVGVHVADIRDPQIPTDVSLYKLESRAWQTTVLGAVASGQKTLTLPGGYLGWNAAWPAADRGKIIDETISKFLADWASLNDAK